MNLLDLARVLRAAADEAERIASEQADHRAEWVDQHGSQLGRRRHCARVRARVAAAEGGASIQGRRFLLSQEAYAQELERPRRKGTAEPTEIGARLRRRLGMVA